MRLTSLAGTVASSAVHHHGFPVRRRLHVRAEHYGPIEACLAGAAIFLLVTALAAGSYMVRKHQVRVRAEQAAKSATHSLLADPAMVAIGLQLVRAIGVKRLVPILAIGGVALGFLASRGHAAAEEPRGVEFASPSYTAVVPA